MCDDITYTWDSLMWVVPNEDSLPCKVALQILVASIQLIIGLDPHTNFQSSPVCCSVQECSSYNIIHYNYYWLDLVFVNVIHTRVAKTGT